MSKIKTYKNVREFSQKVLKINDYEYWLISFKNRLIKSIVIERNRQNISQVDLAKTLKTTQSVISRLESGTSRNITIDYLLKVITALGVPPEKMMKKVS